VSEVELHWVPSNTVEVSDAEARSLLKIDALEDLDDVQNVTANLAESADGAKYV